MSTPQDPEAGNDPTVNPDLAQSTPNQPSQLESNIGDSSEPIFSMYTEAAEVEDNDMVETWQKDAKGILIFTGLFSATVAALLTITIPDLKPNNQDTSNFYLGNIYQVLYDPNVSRSSIPSPTDNPLPFSAPRSAVWVNSLWFLSLVMSVSCALWATSLNQWARRYIRLTQPARCSPDKRARMREFFANGVDKMHTPWAVEGLPMLLHLSLFLFFGGLAVYLFNVNQEVFICVASWIGLFLAIYGLMSVLPIIRHDSLYNTPLSIPLWLLYAFISRAVDIFLHSILYLVLLVLAVILFSTFALCNCEGGSTSLLQLWESLTMGIYKWPWRDTFLGGLKSVGVKTKAEETVEEQSSEIDGRILGWTINTLGDDESLEAFFEAMPGFFDSEKVKYPRRHLPCEVLQSTLAGFLGRTLSSKSIVDSVKLRRLDTFMKTISLVGEDTIGLLTILETFLSKRWNLVPQTIEVAQTLAHWCNSNDPRTALYARYTVTRVLATVPECDDRWVELAVQTLGQPERDLRDLAQTDLAHMENNLLLIALIGLCRQAIHSHEWKLVLAFSRFNTGIRHTLPRLRHDFCTLWNELIDEGRTSGDPSSPYFRIVCLIGHHFNDLHRHRGARYVGTATSTDTVHFLLIRPDSYHSYPKCIVPHHLRHSDSIVHACDVNSRAFPLLNQPGDSPHSLVRRSTSDGITVSRQVKQEGITTRLRSLSEPTPKDIAEAPTAASPSLLPVHIGPYPIHSSLSGAVAAPQYIPPTATSSRPPEGTSQQETVPPCGKPDIGEILSTASTPAPAPTPVPVPTSTPPVLKVSLASNMGSASASASDPLPPHLASTVVGVLTPPPSRDRFSVTGNAESLALLSNTTPSHPTSNATLPLPRILEFVNTGNMSSANAVLQLLVHSPPLWDLFRELGKELENLKGWRRAGDPETDGGATPLVDSTVRFFEEFISKEEPLQQAATGEPSEDEEVKMAYNVADSFEPMYMYHAMKEKRRLKDLLDGQQQDAEEFFRLYLDALDEELPTLLASTSGHKLATTAPGVEESESDVSPSGQTELGNRGITVESVESPLMRIFGGKFRSIVRAPNQPDTVTIERWRSLHLNIQHDSMHTIEDTLARISDPQPVQLGSSGLIEASQQVFVEELPQILVLHLKRFLYDGASDGIAKISKHVHFPPELVMPLEIMVPNSRKSVESAHYKLYGVLYHHGDSASIGRYTVDVLHPNEDGGNEDSWMRINDEVVSAVRHEDVFGGHVNDEVDDRCAYMLFYCRSTPTQI